MKLLYYSYTIILFSVIQLVRTDNVNVANQLAEDYEKQLNTLSNKICVDLKYISEQILKDAIVQQANTPLMQDFKKNITHFQEIYPFYARLSLNETLIIEFSNMVAQHYEPAASDKDDAVYIRQLLIAKGYDSLRDRYKNEFRKFITTKFTNKFENLKRRLLKQAQVTKFDIKCLKWANKLMNCTEYECYFSSFKKLTLTRKDKFIGYIQRNMLDLLLSYCHNASVFVNGVLQDPKLSQLQPELKKNFVIALNHLVNYYKGKEQLLESFFVLPSDTAVRALLQLDILGPLKDLRLLTEILEEHNFAQAELQYKMKYDEFVNQELVKEFERFKASINRDKIRKEKMLVKVIDILKNWTTFDEISVVFLGLDKADAKRQWQIQITDTSFLNS